MAMSRTKSFLLHTQKNLWRRDTQHDLTVIDSEGEDRQPHAPLCWQQTCCSTLWGSEYELLWGRVAEQAGLSGSSTFVK